MRLISCLEQSHLRVLTRNWELPATYLEHHRAEWRRAVEMPRMEGICSAVHVAAQELYVETGSSSEYKKLDLLLFQSD